MLGEAVMALFVERVFNFLVDESGGEERVRLFFKGDPQRKAFKGAFVRAYQKFDQAHHQWTQSLFDGHFLETRAAPLLARCLTRTGAPQAVELAVAWVEQLNHLSDDERAARIQELTPVASKFLAWLDDELRACGQFDEIFDSYALDVTANATTQMAETIKVLTLTLQALPAAQLMLMQELRTSLDQLTSTLQQLMSPPTVSVTRPALPANQPVAQLSPPKPAPRAGICPFEYGSTVPPKRFYGRDDQRADIKTRIGGISAQCVSLVGMRRSGKSSLLRYIRGRLDEFCPPEQEAFVVRLDLHLKRFHTPVGLVEGLRRGIKKQIGHSPWERDENDDEWAVEDGLLALRDEGKRLIVLIDEFEAINNRLDQFHGWGEDWRSKAAAGYFALVIATLRPIDEVYEANGLSSPFGNLFTKTELGAFTDNEWQALVSERFALSNIDISDADMALIYELAGGHPFYTQMAGALLWQYSDHAQTRTAFVHQARVHFAELWNVLKENERQVLRYIAGVGAQITPDANLRAALQRYGLLRADGLFSSAFTEFVRGQR